MGGEWICLGVVDLLGIISFFLLSLVVRKLVVGYLKDTNAGEWLCVDDSSATQHTACQTATLWEEDKLTTLLSANLFLEYIFGHL